MSTQVDYCMFFVEGTISKRQHRLVICRMIGGTKEENGRGGREDQVVEIENGRQNFREKLRQSQVLLDDWASTIYRQC